MTLPQLIQDIYVGVKLSHTQTHPFKRICRDNMKHTPFVLFVVLQNNPLVVSFLLFTFESSNRPKYYSPSFNYRSILKERKSAATTFSPPHKMIDTPLFPASSPSSCLAHFSPSSLICLTTISTTFCQCVSELLFQRQKEMSQEETKRGKHDRKGIACTL